MASSPPIVNTEWIRYTFTLHPRIDIPEIIIDANFTNSIKEPYNGHILIDAASDLIRIEKPE